MVARAVDDAISSGEQHLARARQHDLCAAEGVGAGRVGQHQVRVGGGAERRIPYGIAEVAALSAGFVGAIAEHAAVRQQRHVHGNQRPAERGSEAADLSRVAAGRNRHRGFARCGRSSAHDRGRATAAVDRAITKVAAIEWRRWIGERSVRRIVVHRTATAGGERHQNHPLREMSRTSRWCRIR